MKAYWVLGHMFNEGHDRAIRYPDLKAANKVIKDNIPKEKERVRPDWCDICNLYHVIRESEIIIVPKK